MKNIFKHCQSNILKGMPAGMLVTCGDIDFDIESWQHKWYDCGDNIISSLKKNWCSRTVNVMITGYNTTEEQIEKFFEENDFLTNGNKIYLVYLFAIPTNKITDRLTSCISKGTVNINRFSQSIVFEDYTIFVNDFIKNILYL